jgi:amino acid transporter
MGELKKSAGYGLIISLLITSMIGTSVFFGSAVAAGYSGNASLVAWFFLGLLTIYVGACFGELVGLFPAVGGVYEFAKRAYGRFPSFMIGWITWLVASITTSVILVAAVNYLNIPALTVYHKVAIVIGFVLILNYVAFRGIEASTAVLLLFASILVGTLLAVIIPGLFSIKMTNFVHFIEGNPLLIFVSLFFIVEAFFGWESATFLAEETKNAERIIPRSLIITSTISACVGLLIAFVSLGIIPWQNLAASLTPVSDVAFRLFGSIGQSIINMGIFFALIGSAAGGIIAAPRLILALAKDKLFIEQFSAIHPKHSTPYRAIVFQMIVSIFVVLISVAGGYRWLLSLLVPLALVMYITVLIAVPVLRRKYPDAPRPFKVPFGYVGPIFIALVYLGIILSWVFFVPEAISLIRIILSFILFGIPIYLFINIFYNPEHLVSVTNRFSGLQLWFENILLPKKIKRVIVNLFSDLRDKTILEFGSGVGTLTIDLAEIVGPKGKIYAVDFSTGNIKILVDRVQRHGHKHVEIIHDEHLISRLHPGVKVADAVFSVGYLSYLQDPRKVLREIHSIMPENGKICFVEYIEFFWGLIPGAAWLDDTANVEKMFREIGFSVTTKKMHGFLWEYLFVYGIKSEKDVPYI